MLARQGVAGYFPGLRSLRDYSTLADFWLPIDFRWPTCHRPTTPLYSPSSNRPSKKPARPSQFPQDDPSVPVGSGIRTSPRLLIESPGVRCVDRPWAQHGHPDIPALQFVEPSACGRAQRRLARRNQESLSPKQTDPVMLIDPPLLLLPIGSGLKSRPTFGILKFHVRRTAPSSRKPSSPRAFHAATGSHVETNRFSKVSRARRCPRRAFF